MGRYESLLGQDSGSEGNNYGYLNLPDTSIPNQGEGATVGGVNTQLESLRNALIQARTANEVDQDSGIFDQAKDIATGAAGGLGNAVLKTLEVLDGGRALVVSGLTELDDLIRDPEDASWSDVAQQTRDHIGVGDWLDDSDLPWAVRSGLGFVGDVLLDPTTYATLGTSAAAKPLVGAGVEGAEAIGERVAREGAETLAERVARRGSDELVEQALGEAPLGAVEFQPGRILHARDVARRLLNPTDELSQAFPESRLREVAADVLHNRSPASVPSEMRPFVGIDTGLFWGLGRNKVRIPGTDVIAERVGRLTGAAKRGLFDKLPVPDSARLWPKLTELRREGPEGALKAFELEMENANANFLRNTVRSFLFEGVDVLRKEHGEEFLRTDDLFRQLDEGVDSPAANGIRDLLEQARKITGEITKREVPEFENYVPYRRTRELLEVLSEKGGKQVRNGDEAFRNFRQLRPGGEFLGHELDGQSSIRDQVEAIAKETFGDDYVQVLRDDPLALVGAYIDEISGPIHEAFLLKRLDERGLLETFRPVDWKQARKRGQRIAGEGVHDVTEQAQRQGIENEIIDAKGKVSKTRRRGFALGREIQDLDTAIDEGELSAISAGSNAEDIGARASRQRWDTHDEAADLITRSIGDIAEMGDEDLVRAVADENTVATLERALGGDLSPAVRPDVTVVKGLPHNAGGTYHVPHGTYMTARTSRGLEVLSPHGRQLGVVPDEEAARELIQEHADTVVSAAREEFDAARTQAAAIVDRAQVKPEGDRGLAAQPWGENGHETVIGNTWRPDPTEDPNAALEAVRSKLTMKDRRLEPGVRAVDTELGVYQLERLPTKRGWKVTDPYGNVLGTARGVQEAKGLIRQEAPQVMERHLQVRLQGLEAAYKAETGEADRLSQVILDTEAQSKALTDRLAELRASGEITVASGGVGGKGSVQVETSESFARRLDDAKPGRRVRVTKKTAPPADGTWIEVRVGDVDADPKTWITVRGRVDGEASRRGQTTYFNLRTKGGTRKVAMRPNDDGIDSILPAEVAVADAFAPTEAVPVADTAAAENLIGEPRTAALTTRQRDVVQALMFDVDEFDTLGRSGITLDDGVFKFTGTADDADLVRAEVENLRQLALDRPAAEARVINNAADKIADTVAPRRAAEAAPTPKVKIPSKTQASYSYRVIKPGSEATIVNQHTGDVVEATPLRDRIFSRPDARTSITEEASVEMETLNNEQIRLRTILGDSTGVWDSGTRPSPGLKGERARRIGLAREYEIEAANTAEHLAQLRGEQVSGAAARPVKARTREAIEEVASRKADDVVANGQILESHRVVFGSAMTQNPKTSSVANDLRIAELVHESTKPHPPDILDRIDHELAARSEAARLYAASSSEVNEDLRQVALFEAQAEDAYAQAVRDKVKLTDLELRLGRTEARTAKQTRNVLKKQEKLAEHVRLEEEGQRYADAWARGFRDNVFGKGATEQNVLAQRGVLEAYQQAVDLAKPEKVGQLLRLHDTLLSRWKGYSLLTPGFHIRNTMGGIFNNGLAGVRIQSYSRWTRAMRQMRSGFNETETIEGAIESIRDPRVRQAVREMMDENAFDFVGRQNGARRSYGGNAGIRDLSDAESGDPLRRGLGSAVLGTRAGGIVDKADPTSLDFFALEMNRRMGGKVERFLRGPLYIDRRLAGYTKAESLEDVARFHFDYNELSQLEAKVARRVLPFYTWTRKNFPLQLEYIARKPGAYTWWTHARDNLESGSAEDPIVPAYYEDLLAIRLPFTDPRGGAESAGLTPGDPEAGPRMYLTLDLPFRDLAQTFDTNQLLSSLSPFIKTPLEVNSGEQFFSGLPFRQGLQEAPSTWAPIMPILQAAGGRFGLPRVTRGSDGRYLLTEADAYKIESFFPLLGRTRRLAPSESRYDDRLTTTWLSVLAGISTATNNSAAQYGETRNRTERIENLVERWKQTNFPSERQGAQQ